MRERRSLTLSIGLCLCLLIFARTAASASDVQEARPAQDPTPTPIAKVEPLQNREGRPLDQRSQPIIFSDDFGQQIPQSRFHLDRALNMPDWLHLGLQSRWRYESYSQPLRKNETTGGAQFSEQALAQLGVRYKPFLLVAEFLDARPLHNFGLTVNSKMEDRNDVLQLYLGIGTDRFLWSNITSELRVGKFTLDLGSRRLISRVNFTNVPSSFLGAHGILGTTDEWKIRTFVMRPVRSQQTSPDQINANTLLAGIFYQERRLPWVYTELYLYYTSQNDRAPGSGSIQDEESTHGERQNSIPRGFVSLDRRTGALTTMRWSRFISSGNRRCRPAEPWSAIHRSPSSRSINMRKSAIPSPCPGAPSSVCSTTTPAAARTRTTAGTAGSIRSMAHVIVILPTPASGRSSADRI